MRKILHDVQWTHQNPTDCVQTAAAALLASVGKVMSVEDIKRSCPTFITKVGKDIGTPLPGIAVFMQSLGYQVTIHSTDIELLDRSWSGLSNDELQSKLLARRKFIKSAYMSDDTIDSYVDSYCEFLKHGGKLKLPILTKEYIHKLLKIGPLLVTVSYNYLHSTPKYSYSQTKHQWSPDDISGRTTTHTVVLAGYEDDKFFVVDSIMKSESEGKYWIDSDHLIGAICLAETEWDNSIISIEPR